MFNLSSWSRKIPGRRGCFIRNFSNEPTIFLHAGFSSNKIVVCILKRYCCFLLCFLLHSLLRCFLIVKESRSGHPLQLFYLHTLCYWLEDGHWLRPLANIYTYIYIYIFWPNRPRANWLSRKNYYSLSHFSPSVDSLSLSLSLSAHWIFFLSLPINQDLLLHRRPKSTVEKELRSVSFYLKEKFALNCKS